MRHPVNTLICLGALGLASGPLMAEQMPSQETAGIADQTDELQNAKETVQEAAKVVEQLRTDAGAKDVLNQARAVFIVPDYARAALGVGAAGGQGVLVANNDGTWSGPAFYNIGTLNLGLAAGAEAGSIAFLIMSDDAMKGFHDKNNFSLNADAGLTIIDWSKRSQTSAGKGADVIVWADTEGLYGDLAVSVSDIFLDEEANRAYYNKDVAARDITQGSVRDPMSSSPLEAEFSAMEAGEPIRGQPDDPMGSQPSGSPTGSEPSEVPQGGL